MAKTKKNAKKPGLELNPEEICPIRQTLKLLGKRWTILIIKEINYSRYKRLSFMDIRRRLVNSSAKVLSERLKDMLESNLIKRKVQSEAMPPRVYYYLTEKGRDACKIVDDLKKYGLKWGKGTFNCENMDCELCAKKRGLE